MKNRHFLEKPKILKIVICVAAVILFGVLSGALFPASPVFADYEYNGRDYNIDQDYEIDHGVVRYPFSAVSGEYVTVTAEPDAGYITASLTVLMDDGDNYFQYNEEVPEIAHPDPDTITFRMPNGNVLVVAEFGEYYCQRVFICDMEGGTVESDMNLADYGDTVTLTVRPDNGWTYVPGSLKLSEIDPVSKEEHEISENKIEIIEENVQYSFRIRSSGYLCVRAEFTELTEETKYQVSVDSALENGSLSVDEEWASPGWTVTVTAKPDTNRGFGVKTLSVTDSGGQPIDVTHAGDSKYTFTMPEDDVFVTAVFDMLTHGITLVSEDVNVPEGRSTGCSIDAVGEETTGNHALLTLNMPAGTELARLTAVGDDSGTEYPCTLKDHREESYVYHYVFTMPDEPVTVTAHFTFTRYTIDIGEDFEGTVMVSQGDDEPQPLPYDAVIDETVSLIYNAPEHYDLGTFRYRYPGNGRDMTINTPFTDQGDNVYTVDFTMPKADVTLIAELVPEMAAWSDVKKAIEEGPEKQTVTLYGNVRGGANDKAITIEQGREITLDLNGYTLDRNVTAAASDGYVIRVMSGGTLTIISSDGNHGEMGMITGGNATGFGGGILCEGRVNLNGGSIYDNHAGEGGGVCVNKGEFWMRGGEIENNRADNGAGIHVRNGGSFNGLGGTVKNNFATSVGGGICMHFGNVYIKSMEISGNMAENGGGIGRKTYHSLYVYNSSIKNNTASNEGGGLYVDAGGSTSVDFADTTFSGNKAKAGAGALISWNVSAWFTNVTFEENAADENGGGLLIRENSAEKDRICEVKGCTFRDNTAQTGGGIFLLGEIRLNAGRFRDNQAANGGGIYSKGTLRPEGCEFTGNRADKGGGAVCQGADSSLEAKNSVFDGNAGEESGGAFYMESGDKTYALFQACSVTGNTAETGGGIYTAGKGTLVLEESVMSGNHADAQGGAIYTAKSGLKLILMGVDIRNNIAVKEGGGILAEGTMIGMKGVVTIRNNTSEESAPHYNLCFGADSFVANPGLYNGSYVCISTLSQKEFGEKISRYQLRYFKPDSGSLHLAVDGIKDKVDTPMYASGFGSGSKILILTLIGAAAAAAVLVLRKKKKKEGTKDDEKEA